MDRINDNDNDMYFLIRCMVTTDLDSDFPAFLRGLGSFFIYSKSRALLSISTSDIDVVGTSIDAGVFGVGRGTTWSWKRTRSLLLLTLFLLLLFYGFLYCAISST